MEFKKEKCVGGKFSKWRLTGLARLTDNALGQKLSMFMTGKANKPRCFKNLKRFSCRYRSQKKVGWTVIRLKIGFVNRITNLRGKTGKSC